jgi:hypothetical protein
MNCNRTAMGLPSVTSAVFVILVKVINSEIPLRCLGYPFGYESIPIEVRRVAGVRQHPDAGEGYGDGDVPLVPLVARREHLLAVPSQLLTSCDKPLLCLRLGNNKVRLNILVQEPDSFWQ